MTPTELKELRIKLGWTQQKCSDHLGITIRTYKYYEEGVTSRGAKLDEIPKSIATAMLAFNFAQEVKSL